MTPTIPYCVFLAVIGMPLPTESSAIVELISSRYARVNTTIKSIEYIAECSGRTAVTPDGALRRWHLSLSVAGKRRFVEIAHYYRNLGWESDPRRCQVFLTPSGLEEYWVNRRVYKMYDSIPESRIPSVKRLQTEFIFECTGIWPRACRMDDETNVSSIVAILRDGPWRLSKGVVNGHSCVSVNNDDHALAFAPAMGYALVRRVSRFRDSPNLSVAYENSEFLEVKEGIWIPGKAERTITRSGLEEPLAESIHMLLEDVWSYTVQDLTSVRINSSQDADFRPHLLPGTIYEGGGDNDRRILSGGEDMLHEVAGVVRAIRSESGSAGLMSLRGVVSFLLWMGVGAGCFFGLVKAVGWGKGNESSSIHH